MAAARDTAELIAQAWRRELPDTSPDSIGIITRIWRAGKLLSDDRRRTLTELGIDRATLDLLSVLRRAGEPYELTPAEIARESLVSAGAISQRVTRAEQAGLITLSRTAGGRTSKVGLSEEGHRWVDNSVAALLEHENTLIDHLSARQQQDLARLLKSFLVGLHEKLDVPDSADLER